MNFDKPYIPEMPKLTAPGEWIFERIRTYITHMQENQKPNQGVVVLYDTPGGERLSVGHLTYHYEAGLVAMYGRDSDGNDTVALVPATELQITVRYIQMQQHERRLIGFEREA